jgi:hypothetical protein
MHNFANPSTDEAATVFFVGDAAAELILPTQRLT